MVKPSDATNNFFFLQENIEEDGSRVTVVSKDHTPLPSKYIIFHEFEIEKKTLQSNKCILFIAIHILRQSIDILNFISEFFYLTQQIKSSNFMILSVIR